MYTWKPYSIFLVVSSGIAITGFLWRDAGVRERSIRGEHVAACVVAASERSFIPWAAYAGIPEEDYISFYTNYLTPYLDFSYLYGRSLFKLVNISLGWESPLGSGVFWIDPNEDLPTAGDYLVNIDPPPVWKYCSSYDKASGVREKRYGIPLPTRFLEGIATSYTYIPSEDTNDLAFMYPFTATTPGVAGGMRRPAGMKSSAYLATTSPTAFTNLPVAYAWYADLYTNVWGNIALDPSIQGDYENWWPKLGLGDTLYSLNCEQLVATNIGEYSSALLVHPFVAVTNLDQVALLASNLSRTVSILTPQYLTSAVITTVSGNGDAYVPVDTPSDETPDDMPDAGEMWDLAVAGGISGDETVSVSGAFSGDLASFYMSAGSYYSYYYYGPGGGLSSTFDWDGDARYSVSYSRTKVVDGSLTYPPAFAYEHGYVKKITVYAVVIPVHVAGYSFNLLDLFPYDEEWNRTVTGSVLPPTYVLTPNFSATFSMKLPEWTVDSWDGDVTESSYSTVTYGGSNALPSRLGVRLSSVGSWSDPTAPPVFDFGVLSQSFPSEYSHSEEFSDVSRPYTWEGETYNDYTSEDSQSRSYSSEYIVTRFIVIIDWNWEMFGGKDYDPPKNTPPWLTK